VDASGCVTERKTAMDTHAVLGRSGAYLIVVFVRHGALFGSRLGRGEVVSAKPIGRGKRNSRLVIECRRVGRG
jgi:hypothetical protein